MATLTMESEVLRDLDLAGPLTVSPGLRNSTEIAVSKAGLYVLIQGLLDIRPRFDRTLLQSQLQIRYGLQVERLSSDLIHASLRVLHDAVEQKQPPRVIATYRSFCINTVPVLLRQSQLRAMRFQMDGGMGRAVISAVDRYSQACMMNRLTENLSGGTDELQIDDAFLESCRALGVVQQRDEASYAGAPEKTYGAFQQIVGQRTALIISSDPSHMDTFVVELTKARGTAEALVQGLIENMKLCAQGDETEQLAAICDTLLLDASCLDLIALHCDPVLLFEPLISVIDGHKCKDHTRESYEHHASILIFAQIFARRFSLTIAELRLDPGGVLAPLLDPDTRILRQDQLSASASEAVGTWILRLLDEMEHGREVLTKYTPELTNKIMPTIFDQCLSAFTAGIIEWKSIERLIVHLLDGFFIAALAPILRSFIPDLWRSGTDPNSQLKVLLALVTQSPSLPTSMRKHQLVLQLFVFQIQSALSAAPESVDTSPVVEKLTFLIPECPRSLCEQTELQQICSTPNGGILKHISHIFQSLLDWAYDPNAFAKNPAYRFRHITAACLLTGSTAVLNVLVEEILKAGSLMGSAQSTIAMEVAHAIICTPVPERHNKGAMTLRSALSNNQLLYYGRNGVPSIDTGSYISGGRESIIEDLHRAVLQSHTTMIEDSDHDFMQEAPILRSQVRAFSGMEEGLGLTGVPTDLAIDFGSQPLDPSGVTPLTGDPLATNIDFGNLPLDFDLSQPLPTIDTKPLTAQPALDPNSMLTDMDLEAVLPFMDEAAQANALQLPIGSVEDYQPDPNYDVAQLQALGSDFNFDADAWDDFAGFDDAVLPQLRGDGAGGGRGAGTLGTGTGLDVAGANLDGMDFAFLDSQA